MPVEIKELVIRAVVKAAKDPMDEAGGSAEAAAAAPRDAAGTEDIVQECVRQVLHILARKKER
jgi:hypothetical protein